MNKRDLQTRTRAALKKAADQAGSVAQLARNIKVQRQNLHVWLRDGHVPAKHIVALERETGIPRREFRLDLYE